MKRINNSNMFAVDIEEEALSRIHRFAKIAKAMDFDIAVGFSGGKDSQVVYDLCKRAGIKFTAYYNECFESNVTKKFIRDNYPDVIWRREHKSGFIQNIAENHKGLLPTVQRAFCCEDYKHNSKYVDKCSMTGVRKAESKARSNRTSISFKNKTTRKKMQHIVDEYFVENCQSTGTANIIALYPIVDWTDDDVWNYINAHNLPINPEYSEYKRIGCIVCPKANFTSNYKSLLKYPKLIDAFIWAKSFSPNCDWVITSENADFSDDKVRYICRWLNHSFMPFTKKQEALFEQVKQRYLEIHKNDKK